MMEFRFFDQSKKEILVSYRFQSKATGDVLMLGPVGDAVLTAMGIEPAAKGIIQPEAMPTAIRAIEDAVAQETSQGPADRSEVGGEIRLQEELETVSLRQRAWPLLEMMRRAHAAGEAIVWGV